MRDDTVAALERGDPYASGARFVDYWTGAGTWAALPERRREVLATAMPTVKDEWDAAFREPTPLSAFAALDMPVLYITGSDSPLIERVPGDQRPAARAAVEIDGVRTWDPVHPPDR